MRAAYAENKQLQKYALILLLVYLGLIVLFTVVLREPEEDYHYILTPFWSYASFSDGNVTLRRQIILNILMFIPVGFLLTICIKGSGAKAFFLTLLIACLFSSAIEAAQLFFKLGLAEFDDVFDNTLGAAVGAAVGVGARKLLLPSAPAVRPPSP